MIFLSKFFYVFDIISDHHSKNTADTFILISIFDLISPKKKKNEPMESWSISTKDNEN